MALKTYSTAPYYDDFDKTKNYMRILFRPGYSVQARELTQMQTAIQAQIDRFGRHVFKEGSPAVGGLATLDQLFAYVKILSTPASSGDPDPDNFYTQLIGTTVTGATSGVTATVLDATPSEGADPLTIFVKYTSSGTDNITQLFLADEDLTSDGATPYTVTVAATETDPVGYGTRVSVNEGAFFVSGNFVYTPSDNIILEKYTPVASARVVYIVGEEIIGSADDVTLKDNAAGSPNASAPGADRYQITLTLAKQSIDLDVSRPAGEENIINLLVVEHGQVKSTSRSEYSELGDILAKRTYEESGNYVLRPFQINIKEYLNDGTNGGQYTEAQIDDNIEDFGPAGTAAVFGEQRLSVGLEPSVAYVNGYRIQLENTQYVTVDKARDTDTLTEQSFSAIYKNYIDVNSVVGLPDIVNFGQLELRKTDNTVIGTARARQFKYVSGSTYRLYLFDVVLSESSGGPYLYSDIGKVYHAYGALDPFTATLVSSSLGSSPNSMLFRLPVNNVKTIKPDATIRTVYDARIKQSIHATGGSTGVDATTTLTLVRGDDSFSNTTTTDWIAIDESDGSLVTIADITPITASSATVTFSGIVDSYITVIVPITRALFTHRIKTYYTNGTFSSGASPNLVAGDYDSLGQTDIVRIKNVYMAADFSTAALITDTDITDRYTLDNGQRDNFYDIARIQLKHGVSAPTGRIKVTYDYFSHGTGDYFSVDSYTSLGDYKNIPSFQSSLGVVQLRDVIDFRPSRDSGGSDFVSPGAPVDPNSIITADIEYYMPRIDKIYVNKSGEFRVARGISAAQPQPPEDPKDAMILYVLSLGAYTFSAADTLPTIIDNRRYTMRDIGKIEKRLSKIEYYTSLSLLEKDAAGAQIFDGSNVRYKNGFIVDNFYGHSVGAITHPDYSVSMDKESGKLRPMYYEDNARLILNTADLAAAGLKKTGSLLTLNYTQLTLLSQPYASYAEFVNPYNVFNWAGELTLSPNTDEWKETKRAPDVIIDQSGMYDSLVSMADSASSIGTIWNEWTTNWFGKTNTFRASNGNIERTGGVHPDYTGIANTIKAADIIRDRTNVAPDTVLVDIGDKVVEINFVPFIRSRKIYFRATRLKPNTRMYAFFDGVSMADYVRDESGTGNDGYVEYSDRTEAIPNLLNQASHPDGATTLITDSVGTLVGSFVIPNTEVLKFKTGIRLFRLTNSSTNIKSPNTSAETSYFAQGLMGTVEHNLISTRVPRMTPDKVETPIIVPEPTPIPKPPIPPIIKFGYINFGLPGPNEIWKGPNPWDFIYVSEVDDYNRANPGAKITKHFVLSENYPGGRMEWANKPPCYVDPLAQSFMIDSQSGAFITSLDLFFAEKDPVIPVTVQIRTMVNGVPTQIVVPFSQVSVDAANINVTDDATTATTFTFEAPVHLMQNIEYCFVVLGNSDKHKVYVSELGEFDITEPEYRITKQPYAGVMFKSANASTWTPEQTKDIKFNLKRAVFEKLGTATFVNAPLPLATLSSNPIQTTNSSGTVRVFHKNHGHFAGTSYVTLSGIEANDTGGTLNDIPIVDLNTTHLVVSVEIDSYTITPGGTANATDRGGGASVYATENKTYNILHPIVQQSIIPRTNINWQAKVTTGESLVGSEDPHTVSGYININVNDNTSFNRPHTIVSEPNITPTSVLSGSELYSLYLKGVLTSFSDNISPVIDLDRISAVTVANRIDNPAASATSGYNVVSNYVAETAPLGGSCLSKYITRKIDLNDPATSLHIYTLVNRPAGSDIALYYKTLPNGSDINFDDIEWTLATPDSAIPTTDNPNDYTEAQYSIPDMDEFGAFAVKIAFTAQNSSAVATCRDFRAIAST